MCGIVGMWQRQGEIDRERVIGMRDALEHRGPDSDGLWSDPSGGLALGFRRLAIIDLSSAGDQPFVKGGMAIVFNGEIVNYRELRDELVAEGASFRSEGDAEVIITAATHWGVERTLERLRGMFAIALWELGSRRLVLARDRFGIKPLYYFHDGNRLLFSSEMKGLLAHPGIARSIDQEGLGDYLSYGYVPYDRSIISGIRKLPAAHMLELRDGRVSVGRYWRLEYRPRRRSRTELVDELRGHLHEAARLWSVGDVPVGLFLSGGIDSSAVCALSTGVFGAPPSTFSIGFDYEEKNELGYARQVAEAFGCEHHEKIVAVSDAEQVLDDLAEVYDEPFYDTSAVPTLHLSRFTAERVKVALGGDGGDELFYGYSWYERFAELERGRSGMGGLDGLISLARRIPYAERSAALDRFTTRDSMRRYRRLVGFFDEVEQRAIAPTLRHRAGDPLWLFRRFWRPDLPLEAAVRLLDIDTYLVEDILVKVDRASMAASLEARPPLLDHRLAEFVFTVPTDELLPNGERKGLLKEAMRGLLPDEIIDRSKRGFSAPVRHWLRGDLSTAARERLLGGMAVADGIFDRRAIERMMRRGVHNRWAKLWLLLMFEGWYRRWIHGVGATPSSSPESGRVHV